MVFGLGLGLLYLASQLHFPRLQSHDAAEQYFRKTVRGTTQEIERTIVLRLSNLAQSTVGTYTRGWRRFEDWCRRHGECALPQTQGMVMSWVANDLAYTVGASNMQTYLTAVNDAHPGGRQGETPPGAGP